MPGNSQRRGAVRKNRKGPTVGSGGQGRRALEGRGPTPKAVDRPQHKAHRTAAKAARAGQGGEGPAGAASGRQAGAGGQAGSGHTGSAGRGRAAGRPTGSARSGGTGRRPAPRGTRPGKSGHEIVAGRNSVLEALRAQIPVTTLYVAGRVEADDRVREALKIAVQRGLPVLETPRGELDRLTDGAVHQGLALQVPPYEYAHPGDLVNPEAPGAPLVVALDGVTDPRNLGAVIRSVAAFGGHGVVVPERRSAGMTAAAWKSSAGAAARVPVALASNLTRALEDFRKAGFTVLGLAMEGSVPLPSIELRADEPVVVVVGSEGRGLSRLVRETCDQVVSIPMTSAVESLNAGVAAGIALYEVARQRD